ncbi:JAB domain-containing protein [Polyangium mundeleinium]|uniref:JAB domain-containing protein n=1 Tax=Polyangium mundeleinium TaxID=2995306 RepID=UPI00358DA5CD
MQERCKPVLELALPVFLRKFVTLECGFDGGHAGKPAQGKTLGQIFRHGRPRRAVDQARHASGRGQGRSGWQSSASFDDLILTILAYNAGEVLRVPLSDHVIVAAGRSYFSFRDSGLLPVEPVDPKLWIPYLRRAA